MENKKIDEPTALIKSVDWFFNLTSKDKPLSALNPTDRVLIDRGYKSIVFALVSLISNDVASVGWELRRDGEAVSDDDEVLKILSKPNPLMTYHDFIELTIIFLELTGNAYWWLGRDKMGVVREIWIIPSQNIKPVPKKGDMGIKEYKAIGLVNRKRFSVDEIVHIKYPNPLNPYEGIGTLEMGLMEYDIHSFSKRYAVNFYRNGAIPQGILTTKEKISRADADRIANEWRNKYQGVENSWDIAVLWGGFDYKQLSINPATEKFIEQSKWTRDDLCAVFKVPPSKLGYVEDVNRANAEANNYTYALNCLKPKIERIRRTINVSLFEKLGVSGYVIEYDDVVPENVELKIEREKINIQKAQIGGMMGVLTTDEIRELLGFEAIGDKSKAKMRIDDDYGVEDIERLLKSMEWYGAGKK